MGKIVNKRLGRYFINCKIGDATFEAGGEPDAVAADFREWLETIKIKLAALRGETQETTDGRTHESTAE